MSTTPTGLILDLAGFSAATYVPWGQANYALFGPNGVGKSRTLSAIEHLFNGGAGPRARRYAQDGRSTCSVIVEAHLSAPPQTEDDERDDDHITGFLDKYLKHVYNLSTWDQIRAADAGRLYEEHIVNQLQRAHNEAEARLLQPLILQQRYFEISRDPVDDTLVVRPCYLESSQHPQLSDRLIRDYTLAEQDGTSSLDWSPLAADVLAALDGGTIHFATIGAGDWLRPPLYSLDEVTGHRCVDLRATPSPDVTAVGRHLAQFLEDGSALNAWAEELSDEATRMLRKALPTSTGLHLHVPTHADFLRGDQVKWYGTRPSRRSAWTEGTKSPYAQLSAAEQTWGLLAIHRATAASTDDYRAIVLIDEPEQGLHRAAEPNALGTLAEFGQNDSTWLWCATHSPVLLTDNRVQPIAIREELHSVDDRIESLSSMRRLGSRERDELEALGLGPTDLLATRRAFLLVEGEHDDIVLRELVGTEIAKLNVEILPIRGASKLPGAIEARTLFDFTDALLLALLDAIPPRGLHEAWAEAKKHAQDPDRALQVLSERFPWPKSDESDWMKQWLMRSITRGRGRQSRVEPLGVSKADIIEYLPVQHFVPKASSWEDLRTEHETHRQSKKTTPRDFKKWLESAYGADFGSNSLRDGCHKMDHIPQDFTNLLSSIQVALDEYEAQRPI